MTLLIVYLAGVLLFGAFAAGCVIQRIENGDAPVVALLAVLIAAMLWPLMLVLGLGGAAYTKGRRL